MTDHSLELFSAARRAAKRIWRDGHGYTRAGIMLDDLVAADLRPRTLYEEDTLERERLRGALDAVNGCYGEWTAVTVSQGLRRVWEPRSEIRSPSRPTSIAKDPSVRA